MTDSMAVKDISEYQIIDKIGDNFKARTFKVFLKKAPQNTLVLKQIKPHIYHDNDYSYLMQQFNQFRDFSIPGVLNPFYLHTSDENIFFIQESFPGITLTDLIKSRGKISLESFFEIACNLAKIIDTVHNAGFFHGAIKPNNILVEQDGNNVCLIDFIHIIDTYKISMYLNNPDFTRDTISYISPEQSGRIFQTIDHTTDFYSLGIIFYEMLAGVIPFTSSDPLDIIHSHLAESQEPLHKKNRGIPTALSNIIDKLINKEPATRYHTGSGLLYDLRECQKLFKKYGKEFLLLLGERDHAPLIKTSSIMVGREKQKTILLTEHARSCLGSFNAAIISGPPGIGKTRLVQELHAPIINTKSYFIAGKFNQFQTDVPYSSIVQALKSLICFFLTEDKARMTYWRDTIRQALGINGRLITELIPELEAITGHQPKIPALPPVEAKNRFDHTIRQFLSCLAGPNHPLTIFIDDLQWCDIDTLELLDKIFASPDRYPYIFIIGSYRDNEVDKNHPLTRIIKKINEYRFPLIELRLEELTLEQCNKMISDILRSSREDVKILSSIIYQISGGNPLYIIETILFIHAQAIIFSEPDGSWNWSDKKLAGYDMPDSVLTIFEKKLTDLTEDTLKILQICACLGEDINTEMIGLVSGKDLIHIHRLLVPAFKASILVQNQKIINFSHDKILEAVNLTISPKMLSSIHKQIATTLINQIPEGHSIESVDNLYDIVEHINKGKTRGTKDNWVYADAILNCRAGEKALDSLALNAANKYFKNALELMPEKTWETNYKFSFSLLKNMAKSELTLGNYKESEKFLYILIKKSRADLDKAECFREQTVNHASLGDFKKALDLGQKAIGYFAEPIPEDKAIALKKAVELIEELHKNNRDIWQDIFALPQNTDRKSMIELEVYSDIIPVYYVLDMFPQVLLATARTIYLCLKNGIDASANYALSGLAIYFYQAERFDYALKYEEAAFELAARYPDTFGSTRGINGMLWISIHNRNTPDTIEKLCIDNINRGRTCGDMFNAAVSYMPVIWNFILKGDGLNRIKQYAKDLKELSETYNLDIPFSLFESVSAGWITMMDKGTPPEGIEKKIKRWHDHGIIAPICNYYILKGISSYFLRNFNQAMADLRDAEPFLQAIIETLVYRLWFVFMILASIRTRKQNGQKKILDDRLNGYLNKVRLWAEFGTALRPLVSMIEAETANAKGEYRSSRFLYLNAIDDAGEQKYTLIEGHLNESLGGLMIQNQKTQARFHMFEADRLYEKCHANLNLKLIKERYPFWFYYKSPALTDDATSTAIGLDTAYLIKSSTAISEEINIDELFKIIMKIIMGRIGASKGYLIMEEENGLMIRAMGTKKKKFNIIVKKKPLSTKSKICRAIVRYVKHTRETVVLKDAMREGQFTLDEDVQRYNLRSILCQPIIKQQKLLGVLYLQNNMMRSVFSLADVEFSKLLLTQAAISLEQAVLIDNMRIKEEHISASLKEKELLLKEVHHRVKNNMQIISSLINLQSRTINNPVFLEIFKESHNRIKSMALIHEKLYQSDDLSMIDFNDYVVNLADSLVRSYSVSPNQIKLKIEINNIWLNIDTAIPCGLIINELIFNSLKYAFINKKTGEIRILMNLSKGWIELTVSDNGAGFPCGIDFKNTESLGLQLVNTLVEQLHGEIEMDRSNGTKYYIRFKEIKYKKRIE